ncbi:MAG: Asp-tRNA(Asn)/Glu-tRNA(Gln) amidotransferase subunit GatC [Methanosarcinales archaeon]
MITKKDVEHLGWLARIELSEQEKEEYTGQLNSVLDYFNKLDEINPEVLPTYHVVECINIFREYIAKKSLDQKDALKNAPRKENGYFKAPRIV